MGPVGRNESRAAVVVRLLEMMREAKGRGCDLVVFTECALTPFFPRWWEEDLNACDQWFEREMPGPATHLLFSEAQKLGIGFHLGFAELAEEKGRFQHYNSSILVGPDGQILGKYRKIHLPGLTKEHGENPYRCYEKRYFDVGNLGFKAWRAFGGVVGMCLGNDRRWPETYRVLALQGAELIVLGYNTVADHPEHPELDHLTNFHSMLSMQAGAYQNGCYVVGVAKAGEEEGIKQIGRSAIIAPSGEVMTQCTSFGDELIVHRCNLDQTRLYKEHIFHFASHRQIEAYALITETRGSVAPQEPLSQAEQPVSPAELTDAAIGTIQKLLTQEYGYSAAHADDLAKRAEKAQGLAESTQDESPTPASPRPSEPAKPNKQPREKSLDPLDAVRAVLADEYHYSSEYIEPIVQQAARALELVQSEASKAEAATSSTKKPEPKPKSAAADILAKARAEAKPTDETAPAKRPEAKDILPSGFPIAADIGWLPGRFDGNAKESPDRMTSVVNRLVKDYRYSEEVAKQVAERAEIAWRKMHGTDELTKDEAAPEEPPPTAIYVPEEHPEIQISGAKTKTPETTDLTISSRSQTIPALSGEEALRVFSVFTDKYGYKSPVARGLAERAYSAWQRWETAQAEVAESAKSTGKEVPKTKPSPPASPPPKAPPSAESQSAVETPAPEFVAVPCPQCDFQLKINPQNLGLLGRKARCPNCQFKFRLPESV